MKKKTPRDKRKTKPVKLNKFKDALKGLFDVISERGFEHHPDSLLRNTKAENEGEK